MPTPNDLDIIQISVLKFPIITNRPWRITQLWMTLILFLNKRLQKSWSLTWFKKLRYRVNLGFLMISLSSCFVKSIQSNSIVLGSMYASRLWTRLQEDGKDNPTHSLSPRGLLHRFRASWCPLWYSNGPLARRGALKSWTGLLLITVVSGLRNNKAG